MPLAAAALLLSSSLLSTFLLSTSVSPTGADVPRVALTVLGATTVKHAEVVTLDPRQPRAFVTSGRSVVIVDLARPTAPRSVAAVDVVGAVAATLDPGHAVDLADGEVTHVEADPAGRGFLAACVVPTDRGRAPGLVAFLDADDLRLLAAVEVGFTPDSCAFRPDGGRLFVANEGEPTAAGDPPGAVSCIRLDGVRDARDLADLSRRAGRETALCGRALLAAGPVRVHPGALARALDLEPEYVAVAGGEVYVTLQENNAIAVLDADTGALLRVRALDAATRRVDASDEDRAARIEREVRALPMPDQLATFRDAAGRLLLVTADEGDDRGSYGNPDAPLGDRARVKDLAKAGRLSPAVEAGPIARLQVSTIDGDLDGDGLIDAPTMQGARSLTVWDAATLTRVGDTGSQLEEAVARAMPERFNATVEGGEIDVDDRSDDRGPEPEGVCVLAIDGVPYAVATLERPGAVAVVRLADPARPEVVALAPIARAGALAPEGVRAIPADRSPTGRPLIVVACEVSSHLLVIEVDPRAIASADAAIR